jgi:hypothetical protein
MGRLRRYRIKGADISLGRGDKHVLRLVEWIEPFNPDPAYPPLFNHIAINRVALMTPDLKPVPEDGLLLEI